MKKFMVNKYYVIHIFASFSNLLFIRSIFFNQVILGYGRDSCTISTIYAKHMIYLINM